MDSIKLHNPSIHVYSQTEVVDHGSLDFIYNFIKSNPPLWAEKLGWIFNKRWRTTLILLGFDFFGAWFGIFVANIYSNLFFGINEPFNYYIYPWISYNIFLYGYIYLR